MVGHCGCVRALIVILGHENPGGLLERMDNTGWTREKSL